VRLRGFYQSVSASVIFHGVFEAPRKSRPSDAVSAFASIRPQLVVRLHLVRAQGAATQRRAPVQNKDTAMGNFIEFAEVAGAVIAAFGLALGLEWVSLYGLTSIMPGRHNQAGSGRKS